MGDRTEMGTGVTGTEIVTGTGIGTGNGIAQTGILVREIGVTIHTGEQLIWFHKLSDNRQEHLSPPKRHQHRAGCPIAFMVCAASSLSR